MIVEPMKLGTLQEVQDEVLAFRELLAEETGTLAVMTITAEGMVATIALNHRWHSDFALKKALKLGDEDAKMISGRLQKADFKNQQPLFVRWYGEDRAEFCVVTLREAA